MHQPNLKHWNRLQRFTLHESICLWLDRNPKETDPDTTDEEYQFLKRAMMDAFVNFELDGSRPYYGGTDTPVPLEDDDPSWDEVTIERTSLVEWARKNGETPRFLRADLGLVDDDCLSLEMKVPVDSYSTPLLGHLRWAIETFWLDYDPTNPPKSSKIIGELEKRNVSNRAAQAIDLIIRPEDRRRGGQVKAVDDE